MTRFSIKSSSVKGVVTKEEGLKNKLSSIQSSVASISCNLSFQISSQRLIRNRLQNIIGDISDCKKSMGSMADSLSAILYKYENYEQDIYENAGGKGSIIDDPVSGSYKDASDEKAPVSDIEASPSRNTGSQHAKEEEKKDSFWEGVFSNVVFPQAGFPGAIAKLVLDYDAGKVQPWADFITGAGEDYMKKGLEAVSKKAKEVKQGGVTAQWAKKQMEEVNGGWKSLKEGFIEGIGKVKKVTEEGVDPGWIKSKAKNIEEGIKTGIKKGWEKAAKEWDTGVKAVTKTAKEAMDDGLEAAWASAKSRMADGFEAGVNKEVAGVGLGLNFLTSGIVSAASNYDEYKEKKGTDQEITVERAVQEFALETAIDVGKGVLVAGAVTAGFALVGITAAPAAAVAVVSAGVIWGADVLCEKITEKVCGEAKGVNEVISDAILDAHEAVQDLKAQAREAVGDAAKAAGKKISAAWNSFTSGWSFA